MKLTPAAINLLEKRYCSHGEKPKNVFPRVGKALKAVMNSDEDATKFTKVMQDLDFLPNSPCIRNAGYSNQVKACFVLPVEDSMEGIFKTQWHTAMIFKSGGGVGYNFSHLREEGATLSHGGTSSGMMSFMRLFNGVTEAVKQGGFRRGASMGVLDVDHPEILDFIKEKLTPGRMNNFNLSVMVDNKFMEGIENDEKIFLRSRLDRRVIKGKFNCRDLFNIICYSAWLTGDPGLLFHDRINQDNPYYPKEVIKSTNPCVTGDTLVMTDCGLQPIKNLADYKYGVGISIDSRFNNEMICNHNYVAFKTGTKPTIKVETKEGYSIKLTTNHQIMTPDGWKEAGNLKVGDKVHIGHSFGGFELRGNEEKGRILGWLVGDGWISGGRGYLGFWGDDRYDVAESLLKDVNSLYPKKLSLLKSNSVRYIIKSKFLNELAKAWDIDSDKNIGEQTITASDRFQRGFLQALFTADGSVQGYVNKGISVRLAQSNLDLLKKVQLMLLNFGIYSKIYKNRRKAGEAELPDGKGGMKKFKTKAQHELVISKFSMAKFSQDIGFLDESKKQDELRHRLSTYKRTVYSDKFIATIESITDNGEEDVYDLNEPMTHSFIANGIVVHNCGEVPLLPYESCCLGSINLSNFVKEDNTFDTERFSDMVRIGTKFLMAMTKLCEFPIKECYEAQYKYQRLGLGVMGFADMLMKMGIMYDSDDALKMIDTIGPIMQESRDYSPLSVATLSIAPTGSLSILADCSSGIEPWFAQSYTRHLTHGTVKEKRSSKYLRTAHQIEPEWHLKVQARWQHYIDNGVSKTINLPHDATIQDVQDIYTNAWKLGCKGITIFRDGCLGSGGQVLRKGSCETEDCYL